MMGNKKFYLVALTLISLILTLPSSDVLAKQDVVPTVFASSVRDWVYDLQYVSSRASNVRGGFRPVNLATPLEIVDFVIVGKKEPTEEFRDKHVKGFGRVVTCGVSHAVGSYNLEKASIIWLYSLKDSTSSLVSHPALFACFPFVEENCLVAGNIYKAKIGGVLRIMIVGNDSEHLINMVKTLDDDIFDVEKTIGTEEPSIDENVEEITGTEEPSIDENVEETTGTEEPTIDESFEETGTEESSIDKNEQETGAQKEAGAQDASILALKISLRARSSNKLNYIIFGQTIILLFLIGLVTYQLLGRKKR